MRCVAAQAESLTPLLKGTRCIVKPNANTYAQMAKLFPPPEFLPRVPEEVTADIRQFCELVVPASAPVFVSVQCGREGYETFQCHRNVLRHIAKHGGSMQHGWLINQYMEGHALDAIFHAVWKDPQTGDLIDVTPPESEGDQVLFLPDPKVKFFGIFVPGFTRLDWNVRGEAFDTLSRFAQEEFKREVFF